MLKKKCVFYTQMYENLGFLIVCQLIFFFKALRVQQPENTSF